MTNFLSEKESKQVTQALYDWVEESGIKCILEENGIREYVFLLIGSAAFGYASKGESDADLMLLYEGYSARKSVDDYKRAHVRIQEYLKKNNGKALKRERELFISFLKKQKEITNHGKLMEKLGNRLGMIVHPSGGLYYKGGVPTPAFLNVKKKLLDIGLNFNDLFVHRIFNRKVVIARVALANSTHRNTETLELDEQLADLLLLLKKGKVVYSQPRYAYEKFMLFVTLFIKICLLCEFTQKYFDLEKIGIDIKKCVREGDSAKIEAVKVMLDSIRKLGGIHGVWARKIEEDLKKIQLKRVFLLLKEL